MHSGELQSARRDQTGAMWMTGFTMVMLGILLVAMFSDAQDDLMLQVYIGVLALLMLVGFGVGICWYISMRRQQRNIMGLLQAAHEYTSDTT